ncbi:cytochrome c oxidase assembly protein COX19 isoform X1 [Polistes fuscatus]|uniref:cytochrome c oxidase assembly protein COX19 isoform X1 n=2 Tax=Polistes TaxID=7456 RepID=UPI001CA8775D|nr:cytochrome c oxidase assembly protein COX19 isoform X1 [Polistes fuscatus]
MSSFTFGQKLFTPVPPEKGSFPLDHEGFCKQVMVNYLRCLLEHNNQNTMCRHIAKDYLGCRMDKDLMAREDWSKLGFTDEVKETNG